MARPADAGGALCAARVGGPGSRRRAVRSALAQLPQDEADALLGQAHLTFFAAPLPFDRPDDKDTGRCRN